MFCFSSDGVLSTVDGMPEETDLWIITDFSVFLFAAPKIKIVRVLKLLSNYGCKSKMAV